MSNLKPISINYNRGCQSIDKAVMAGFIATEKTYQKTGPYEELIFLIFKYQQYY